MLQDAGLLQEQLATIKTLNLRINYNKGMINLAQTETLTRRSRHIEIRYHIVRDWDWVDNREPQFKHVASRGNYTDEFTELLAR